MTLSEFDRRCRGYLRREAAHARPIRWVGTILLNAHRGENDAAVAPEETFWLYGDAPAAATEVMSEEEFNRIAGLS